LLAGVDNGAVFAGVVLAVVSFGLGLFTNWATARREREDELRRRRVEAYARFCANVIEYRRAQLHRWYVGATVGGPNEVEEKRPEVAEDVRAHRAAAWAGFYEVSMICADAGVEAQARRCLVTTKSMKFATDAAVLDTISDQVHVQVADFARVAGATVLARRQKRAVPPPQPGSSDSGRTAAPSASPGTMQS
jgi:hypothetical protein